jgi:hypothetical protein
MKFILGLILGASVSALILYKKTEPVIATPSEEIVSKFRNLSENEARRYAEAKTADEKLKAADALYGKMMILFLADLALKLQPIHQVDPVMVEQTMKGPVEVVEKPATLDSNSGNLTTTAPAQSEKPKDKLTTEAKLQTAYRNSNHAKNLDRRTKRMLGVLEGTLRHTQGKEQGRVDGVVISMDFTQVKKNTLDGSSSVVLTDPTGKEYSRGSSNGGNGSLRLHPDDEDVVFIDASPTSYIALSITKLRGTFVDEGKIIGNVQLHRK